MRRAGLVLAVALTLMACADDADDAVPVTTTTAAEASTTTAEPTTTTATTTFAQADDPPPLVNTGEDFDAIIRSFVAYSEWLSVNPRASLVGEVFREGGPAWQAVHGLIQGYEQRSLRNDGATPASVAESRLLERPSPDLVIVYVVIDNPAYDLVDQAGNVVEHAEADPLTSWAYELRRQADGRWIVEDRTVLGAVE